MIAPCTFIISAESCHIAIFLHLFILHLCIPLLFAFESRHWLRPSVSQPSCQRSGWSRRYRSFRVQTQDESRAVHPYSGVLHYLALLEEEPCSDEGSSADEGAPPKGSWRCAVAEGMVVSIFLKYAGALDMPGILVEAALPKVQSCFFEAVSITQPKTVIIFQTYYQDFSLLRLENFGWFTSTRPTVKRVTFDLPECKEPSTTKSKINF